MEGIIHKHFKENLFIPGMEIEIDGKRFEIQEIKNEVNIGKFFDKDWDKRIVADILIKVDDNYYIVVEINHTHSTDFIEQKKYYDTVDEIIDVLQLTVDKYLSLEHCESMFYLDSMYHIYTGKYCDATVSELSNDLSNIIKDKRIFYINRNSCPQVTENGNFQIEAMYIYDVEYNPYGWNDDGIRLKKVKLEFDLSNKYITQKRILTNFGKEGIYQFFAEVAYYKKSDSCWFVENFYNPQIVRQEKYRGDIKLLGKRLDEIEITPPSICTVAMAIVKNEEIQEKIREEKLKKEKKLEKEKQKAEALAKEKKDLEKIRVENEKIKLFLKEYAELLCATDISYIESEINKLSLDYEETESVIDFCKDCGEYKIQYYRQFYVFMYARNIKLNNVPLDIAFNYISDIIKLNDFIKKADLDSSFCKQMKRTVSLYKKWLRKSK